MMNMLSSTILVIYLGYVLSSNVDRIVESRIPSFTVQELNSETRSSELTRILQTTGILTVKTPTFQDSLRYAALDGVCKCREQLLHLKEARTILLDDEVTFRTTIATATVGSSPLTLPNSILEHCGTDTEILMDRVRDEVSIAANAFVHAIDRWIGGRNTLLEDAQNRKYDRVSSILDSGNHLEHFHIYSKTKESKLKSLDWHTDAGLFLAFLPAVDCQNGLENGDNSFWYTGEDGIRYRAVFEQDSIVIMLGSGAENWISSHLDLRATRHAVRMDENHERAWYGIMYMVPESAIIQKDPPRTLAQMKASLTLSLSSNLDNHSDEAADSISIGCGSVPISKDDFELSRRLPRKVISRRRLQHVGGPEDCNNSTNFFCWMSCLDIPDIDKAEFYEKAGYSLYCLDPSVLALSGSTLSQAVNECPYGVHNAKCLGSWQFTVPGIPSTVVNVNSNDTKQEPFCYGGTSMYMDGFHWKDSVCIIYLFPSWILNSPSKFAAGALGSLFVGGLLEWIIMRRRTVLSVMSPGRSRLFAAAAYYGAQLSLGYLAMLVAMTYSWPLFICIILGIVSGHILFNAKDSLFPVKAYLPKSDSVTYNPGVENGNCCSTSPEQSTADYKEESPKEIPEGSTPCCQYSL